MRGATTHEGRSEVTRASPFIAQVDTARCDGHRRYSRGELAAMRGGVEGGMIRGVGEPGVYIVKLAIVKLAKVNGVLRLGADAPPLAPGDRVSVRIVGSGGVPEVELVSIDR